MQATITTTHSTLTNKGGVSECFSGIGDSYAEKLYQQQTRLGWTIPCNASFEPPNKSVTTRRPGSALRRLSTEKE